MMLGYLARLLTSFLREHQPPPHRLSDRLISSGHTHALKQSYQLDIEYAFASAQVTGDFVVRQSVRQHLECCSLRGRDLQHCRLHPIIRSFSASLSSSYSSIDRVEMKLAKWV